MRHCGSHVYSLQSPPLRAGQSSWWVVEVVGNRGPAMRPVYPIWMVSPLVMRLDMADSVVEEPGLRRVLRFLRLTAYPGVASYPCRVYAVLRGGATRSGHFCPVV